MTTLSWRNVPITTREWRSNWKQPTICGVCGKPLSAGTVCALCQLTPAAELAPPLPLVLLQKAQERLDLMDELRDARADRDRYIARCAELESRLQRIREAVK